MLITLDRFKGKIAVVTGASSGIGAAILEKLTLEGVNVSILLFQIIILSIKIWTVGLARRVERIEELTGKLNELNEGKIYGIKCDLTNEENVKKAFDWIEKNLGPVHILINNAGVMKKNSLVDGDYQKWKQVFDTNVLGLCVATREAIKSMNKHNVDGYIINMNSVLGKQIPPVSGLNTYPASKFAIGALTETLRYELLNAKSNIKVTGIHPGYVPTEILADPEFDALRKMLKDAPSITAEQVVDIVIYVLSTPPDVLIKELTIHATHEI